MIDYVSRSTWDPGPSKFRLWVKNIRFYYVFTKVHGWGCRATPTSFLPPYPWFRVRARSRISSPDQVDSWEGALQVWFIKLWLKMIDHGSRSTWGPSASRSRLWAKKIWSAPTKTGLLYNFCFIMFLPGHTIEAVDAPQIRFKAPLTPGLGYRVEIQLQTFPPSKYIPLPNHQDQSSSSDFCKEWIYIYIQNLFLIAIFWE
jgi:hypothetical protein